jgi:dTDP-4-dehydrorhamnose 3,5-epimerase
MIDGVKIKELKVFKDKPDLEQDVKLGVFMEVLRQSDDLLSNFAQSNFSIAYKDTIKAFHWHKKQDDLWFIASGRAVIVLYDQRPDSPTRGETQVIHAGSEDYKLVLIPVGVVHGYKVLSDEPCLLFYHVTCEYDRESPDEERIDPFDKTINFDWENL